MQESYYAGAAPIVTSDSVDFTGGPVRAIYIGVAGDIVAVVNGVTVTFKAALAGTIIPVRATRIKATNTTATNLIALW